MTTSKMALITVLVSMMVTCQLVHAASTIVPVSDTGAADVTEASTIPPVVIHNPSVDEILAAFKTITDSRYFRTLSSDDQILILELISASEAGRISDILNYLGFERLIGFMYSVPLQHLDSMMQFILTGIQKERLLSAA